MRKRRKNRNVSVPNRRINRWQQISSLKDAAIITECLGKRKKQIVYVFEYGFVCKAPEPAWNKGWSDWNSYEKFFLKRKEFALQVTPAHKNGKEQSGVRCHFCGAWLRALFVFGELSACAYQRFAETRSHTKCENGVWGSPTSKRIGGRLDGDALLATAVFPDSSLSWEQRKLGEVGKARSGVGFPDSEQGGTVGTPFFKVSDMNTAGNENEMTVANNYVTDAQIAARRWSPIEELPAIFFAKVGAAVMLNRKRLCRFPFLLDNNTMAYSLSKDWWDADFAKALFETVDLTSLVQVGALPSYNAGDIESMEIWLPNLREQKEIGAYFKSLDNLITLHQREHAA